MSDCLIVEEKLSLIDCHIMLNHLKKSKGPVGEGQSGKVYILPDINYAIKVIPKREENRGSDSDEAIDEDDSSEDIDEDEDEIDGTSEEDFFSEIDALNGINCPHTIKYYGYYEDDSNFYLVTEVINGVNLENIDEKMFEKVQLIECIKQLVTGLTCIHNSGFAHNDIKLQNIMYDNQHNFYFIDFGLTCSDCEGVLPGNDSYQAPEFITNKNYKNDITLLKLQINDLWGLGLVIIKIALWDEIKDIEQQLDFSRRARGNPSKLEDIINKTIPILIDKIYKRYNNSYIKDLLINLLKTNPYERKLI